ncbi:hypothetical protein CYLTODRAFT_489719 [Cylindrobasidium torrendii FP15055 ss-10]|uniref:F-box domain-containing protein n=1 Tax=Cylindrobasidium torrendii FP15055 ss-10 TaxID=1314674 RepID=A0A0D7BDD5_9AGAR|nr:hypothetical protein CYLTODRAFT_489719 [Cylindrobasidium torrendii FP15055 ss-10]
MSQSTSILTILPTELVTEIICQLARSDDGSASGNLLSILTLRQTCRFLDNLIASSRPIWLAIFAARYDLHDHHCQLDFDPQLNAVRQRTICLEHNLIDKALLRDMVLESVVHNIPSIVRSPVGRSVLKIVQHVDMKDYRSTEFLMVIQAVASATLENRTFLNQSSQRRWLAAFRRGSLATVSFGRGYRYYQCIHIAMLDLLKFDSRIATDRAFEVFALQGPSALQAPPPDTNITGRMLGVSQDFTLYDVLRSPTTAHLTDAFERFRGTHSWAGYYLVLHTWR